MRAEILSSESLSQVSLEADLLFRSLILLADDYGRLDGRIEIIRSSTFPLRPQVTVKKIRRWLDELLSLDDPPVVEYSSDDRPYMALTGWEKHRGKSRRALNSKFPSPIKQDKNEYSASPEIRENPSNPPVGMEVEARVRSRRGGHLKAARLSAPLSGSPSGSEKPSSTKSRKPETFDVEQMSRVRKWATEKGYSNPTLNEALEIFRTWEPLKHPTRTSRQWVSAFMKICRESVDEGKIGKSSPARSPLAAPTARQLAARKRLEDAKRDQSSPQAVANVIEMSLRNAGEESA
jgi:hypothetical protein